MSSHSESETVASARRGVSELAILALLLPACTLRCGDNTFPANDAGADDATAIFDSGAESDGPPPLTSVEFAIGGCRDLDGDGCRGEGPLTLGFTAITSSQVQVYLWQFGDGETSTEATPVHTYGSPGSYTVSLDVEGPGGGLGVSKLDWVTVEPGSLGRACGSDDDCASGLCVCDGEDGACDPPLGGRGICAALCDAATPCVEGTCVDLAPAPAPSPQDWQQTLCLASCDDGCGDGLTCRELLAPDGSWTQGCFPPAPLLDIGDSCVDATGARQAHLCSSGQCLDAGARGLCGFDCTSEACPGSTVCATFAGTLGTQCIADCADVACLDPWLDCEAPGNPGTGGFSIPGVPSLDGYCAPRYCGDDAGECDPDGVCVADYCEAP